jgi:hypothetical protein
VWYFVPDGDGFVMVSHIRDDEANAEGLRRVADHIVSGGRLMLGIQAPHVDYSCRVGGGLRYSQRILPIEGGFRKEYRLDDGEDPWDDVSGSGGRSLMEQTTDYRVYPQPEAFDLLDKAGFTPGERGTRGSALFLEFDRR